MKPAYLIFWTLFGCAICEEVTFDKDSLTAIDESTLSPDDVTEYNDTALCGSKLFSYAAESDKNLAINVRVTHFSMLPTSQYFRAHPYFIQCIQTVISTMMNTMQEKIEIKQGYEPNLNVSSYPDERSIYLGSGCGAVLGYEAGNGNITHVARIALQSCPMVFERIQRDIGIVLLSDGVFLYMTGDINDAPNFSGLSDHTSMSYITQGLDPNKIPDCSNLTQLDGGAVYPSGVTGPESVVGGVDIPITSSNDSDFASLIQYLGNDIQFEDTEGIGCSNEYVGNGVNKRCPDRLMSARMYSVLTRLKAYVKNSTTLGGTLMVEDAWDDGSEHPNSLHTEGRAIRLLYNSSNTIANLKKVSQLAICAGADYVRHNTSYLFIAVRKQKGISEHTVSFPRMTLVAVEPPSSKVLSYSLPDLMSGTENLYPLFDSDGKLDNLLADDAPISKFVAKDPQYRYFRIDPAIVKCYSRLMYKENKLNINDTVEVDVVSAFMSNDEQANVIEIGEARYNTHNLGQALELRYSNNSIPVTRLLLNIIDMCGPVFDDVGYNMNLGLYWGSVYLGVSDSFGFWSNPNTIVPTGYNETTYGQYLDERRQLAIQGRTVDPDDPSEACNSPAVPAKQDIFYQYNAPLSIQRKSANRTHTCNVTSDTSFCSTTLSHRQEIVADLWNTMSKLKTVLRTPKSEVKVALEGCFLTCGTCMEGEIWESKLQHCSNLIHWVPFNLLNEAVTSNIYSRDNPETYILACTNGKHCLLRTPIFSQFAPAVKKTYRPMPTKSVIEELYSSMDNPSPILSLLEEMYVMHATGVINFWVKDDKEISSLQKPLQAAMLYNMNITEIHVYVTNDVSKPLVYNVIERYAKVMATQGCPTYTRETLAPFRVLSVNTTSRKKRDVDSVDDRGIRLQEQRLQHEKDKWYTSSRL